MEDNNKAYDDAESTDDKDICEDDGDDDSEVLFHIQLDVSFG